LTTPFPIQASLANDDFNMDQSLALNALAPYLALAKSATSPRAAADLVAQATSAQNTYVFAELLQQPNIQALNGQEQFGGSFELLKIFAWGTWEDYKGWCIIL
jgi:COP9 signalosome complex subunit 7